MMGVLVTAVIYVRETFKILPLYSTINRPGPGAASGCAQLGSTSGFACCCVWGLGEGKVSTPLKQSLRPWVPLVQNIVCGRDPGAEWRPAYCPTAQREQVVLPGQYREG